jgi:tRNA-modifying protein YgfZ
VLFDFIVFREGDEFLFDVPRGKTAEFAKRLGFYRLRAQVTVADRSSDRQVYAAWGATPVIHGVIAQDPRLPHLGWRIVSAGDLPANASEADYDARRIALGVPEGGIDFAFGDVFPHDIDMDQLSGIDFTKGCYVGQEVVSRVEHRHTARRRVVMVTSVGALPDKGTEITANGKPIGNITSALGSAGLALVRLDRAKEAMDKGEQLTAQGRPLTLAVPPWAKFGWPATATDEA